MDEHEITIIEGDKTRAFSLYELWRHKDVFLFLVWREILVRYKQTLIGVAWIVIRPVLTMLIFTFLFNNIAAFSSGKIPYYLVVFIGLLPWQFFSDSMFFGSGSLVANASMIGKVYFPRIFIPASSVVCCLLDLSIALALMTAVFIISGVAPVWYVVFLPFFILWLFIFTFSVTVGIAALMVRYRDFKYIVSFGLQVGLYVSPVGFSSHVIPFKWRLLYSLNPLVGIMDGFRWCLLGEPLLLPTTSISAAITLVCCIGAYVYFKVHEHEFADVV